MLFLTLNQQCQDTEGIDQVQLIATELLPFLLSGLFRKQTQIWWFSIGSDADSGRKSSLLRYSLQQMCSRNEE